MVSPDSVAGGCRPGPTLVSAPLSLVSFPGMWGLIGSAGEGPDEGSKGKCLLIEQEAQRRLCSPCKTHPTNQVLEEKGNKTQP